MMRRRATAGPLALLLMGGLLAACTGDDASRASNPHVSTRASGSTPPPDTSGAGSWEEAVNQLVEDPFYPVVGEPDVDALHYDLSLRWDPGASRLTGVTTLDFRAPRTLTDLQLDLAAPLEPSAVRLDDTDVDFTHESSELRVDGFGELVANSTHTLRIAYAGEPEPVPAPSTRPDVDDIGWHTTVDGGAWTMQEPWGAHTWYPVNDHPSDKAYYDFRVNTPATVRGVTGGELVSDRVRGDRRITRFRLSEPAASYLTTIAIGDYRRVRDRGPGGLPVTYWVRPDDDRQLEQLRQVPALLGWLTRLLGPFPFPRAGVVLVPGVSAMETQETVTLSARIPPRGMPGVLLHEFAHQWYGDTVTPDNWADLWLNEAFATYLQLAWSAEHGGRSLDKVATLRQADDQLTRDEDGPPGDYDQGEFAEGSVYYSGLLMLLRLRDMVGAEQFDVLLREWPRQHRNATVDRDDWIAWAEQATGEDLEDFVLEWLTSETTPAT